MRRYCLYSLYVCLISFVLFENVTCPQNPFGKVYRRLKKSLSLHNTYHVVTTECYLARLAIAPDHPEFTKFSRVIHNKDNEGNVWFSFKRWNSRENADATLKVIRCSDISHPAMTSPTTVTFVGWANGVNEINEATRSENQNEAVEEQIIEDTTVRDTITVDTTAENEIVEDAAVEDAAVEDAAIEDALVVDTTVEDQIEKFTDIPSNKRKSYFTLVFRNENDAENFCNYLKNEEKKPSCCN